MNWATMIGDGARRLLRRQGRTRNDVRRNAFDIRPVVGLTVQTSGDRVEGKRGQSVKRLQNHLLLEVAKRISSQTTNAVS